MNFELVRKTCMGWKGDREEGRRWLVSMLLEMLNVASALRMGVSTMERCAEARPRGPKAEGREGRAYDIPAVNLTPMDCIENTKTSD
jgi:hypothetical protein